MQFSILLRFDLIKHRHAKRARVIFLVIGSRSIRRTVHSNDLVKFFLGGCDVQQEGNWKSIICKYSYMYIGNGKIAK